MALPPPGFPMMPPHIAAMLAQGQYKQAIVKTTEIVAKEVATKGIRIVQPVARTAATVMRAGGFLAEADSVVLLGESVVLSEEAVAILAAGEVAAGVEGALTAGAAVVAVAEAALPVLCLCVLVGFAVLLVGGANKSQAPNIARAAREEIGRAKGRLCYCAKKGGSVGFVPGASMAMRPMQLPTGCNFPACQSTRAA